MKHAIMIFFLMASLAFAGSRNTVLMPEEFEQIEIGMDWRSLVSLRPNVEIMNMMPNPEADLKPDPDTPRSGLVEKLPEGPYDRVIYSFEGGVLVAVMFGKEMSRSTPFERENAIRRVGQGRGDPSKIQLAGKRYDQGVITWQDQNLHINVIMPTGEADTTQSVVGFQVMDRKYAERIKAIGSVDAAEMDQAQQRADELRLEAFKSKVRANLSANGENSSK